MYKPESELHTADTLSGAHTSPVSRVADSEDFEVIVWWESIGSTNDQKVASSNPDRRGGRVFFFKVNFVC